MKDCTEEIKSVIFGHAVADALGVPAEFNKRETLDKSPITDMIGYGTYPYPEGTWSDDTSMSLATLDSLLGNTVSLDGIMTNFCLWLYKEEYTATGTTFDVGITCRLAIGKYKRKENDVTECGLSDETSNGNGSLMRIHPLILYAYAKSIPIEDILEDVHNVSALTHAHERSKVGCGIYSYILLSLLENPDKSSVYSALKLAMKYYADSKEITYFSRLFDPCLASADRAEIKSSGYVVDTLEAAVWCLLTTSSYRECVLKAVNLGDDTDTVAAVAGGLAGALYGYNSIPKDWISVLKRREYIDSMCCEAAKKWR